MDDEAGSPIEEFKAFTGDSGMNRSQSEYCNVGSKTSLTNHPAKKYVFDFMRVLIMDNLCMTPASKQTPIIDLLLEVRRYVQGGIKFSSITVVTKKSAQNDRTASRNSSGFFVIGCNNHKPKMDRFNLNHQTNSGMVLLVRQLN